MRPLRIAIFGLIVMGIVSVRADTWPWPSVGAQARHGTGIVLLGPIDYNAKFEPIPDQLRKAWNDAYTLAQEAYPDDFGRPWMDLTTDEVVVSAATANGAEIARRWVQSGLRVPLPKMTVDLARPEVPVRIRSVRHSIMGFQRVMDDVIDLSRAGVPGADRIYSAGPDPEHDRVIVETDRIDDRLLEAIAARFGVQVIAVRIDPRGNRFTKPL